MPEKGAMWDTWIYHHRGTFHLYYLTGPNGKYDGVGLATSRDGVFWNDRGTVIEKDAKVTWMGSGAVWPVIDGHAQEERFIMNFSEWRGDEVYGRQTIFFAESSDLIRWARLGPAYEFVQDTRWYAAKGRWDNIWPVPKPGGGYFGYWAATPKSGSAGVGFGHSSDGIHWEACEPAQLVAVPVGTPKAHSPEVSAVRVSRNKYYALMGLDDLQPFALDNNFADFRPGQTTFVAGGSSGPFTAALRNRRLLVGNCSYFVRFVDTPAGVLVNHHSWELLKGAPLNVAEGSVCMAPLKRATWDDEGTLHLKWWEGNERAKGPPVWVRSPLIDTAFDLTEILILEGCLLLQPYPTGFYLEGAGYKGTVFLIHSSGLVEYGESDPHGNGFERKGYVDRELALEGKAFFRLLRKGRITEFYLNDHLMQCYCLPAKATGRIGLVGSADFFHNLKAWYCACRPSEE